MVTAQRAWDLQQNSKGRCNLGPGNQVKAHNERRCSTPSPSTGPGPRMQGYLQCLKMLDGWVVSATDITRRGPR